MNSNSSYNRIKTEIMQDDEEEEDGHPKIMSRVVSKDNSSGITKREQVIAMQSRQNDLGRNKRMFGSLLGTLQKFRKEENFLKTKEEKKAKIEKKLEEQEQLEKIKLKEERDTLIANRKRKQMEVKLLETKMGKLKDLQVYEDSQKHLGNYIKTATKPAVFWLPKVMTSKTLLLQTITSENVRESIEERRKQVDEEIKDIVTQIDKECESNDDHNDKSIINHNNDTVKSENGRERNENSDKGKLHVISISFSR
jgi:pinin